MGGITPISSSLWACAATVWSVIEIQVDSDWDVLVYDVDFVQISLNQNSGLWVFLFWQTCSLAVYGYMAKQLY